VSNGRRVARRPARKEPWHGSHGFQKLTRIDAPEDNNLSITHRISLNHLRSTQVAQAVLSAVPEASDGPAAPPTKLAQELAMRSPLVAKYLKSTINELLDDDDDSFSGGGYRCTHDIWVT
jgi:hypothetical protein